MDYLATLAPSTLEERIVQVLASGPATRGELCDRLDVSRTVLGRALTELRQDGAVRVVAYRSRSEGRGRPVEQLGLAERIACAVGLDVSRTSASGIILDRKGEVLASVLTPLSFDGWREPLDELCQALKKAADDAGVDMSYVSRIGVGLPVPVGQGTGPGTALGEDLFSSVEQIVSPYWSGSLLVDNTIRMTALAEARWGAGQGAPEQIYVHLGGGVGACVIVADRIGGQVNDTMDIENLISVPQTTGPQLAGNLRAHLAAWPVTLRENLSVKTVEKGGATHKVVLNTGEVIETRTLIVASGAKWRELGIPGEKENIGNGVAFCPHCDGPFFKDKDIAVIGGGNSGVEAALDLAGIVKSVTVLEFMPELKADKVLVEQLGKRGNIRVITNAAAQAIDSEGGKVSRLRYTDRTTDTTQELPLQGIFVQIGLAPNSDFMGDAVERTRFGEIVINAKGETNVPGIFAAGDVTTVPYKQIIVAMGEGAKAALSAFDYLIRQ